MGRATRALSGFDPGDSSAARAGSTGGNALDAGLCPSSPEPLLPGPYPEPLEPESDAGQPDGAPEKGAAQLGEGLARRQAGLGQGRRPQLDPEQSQEQVGRGRAEPRPAIDCADRSGLGTLAA